MITQFFKTGEQVLKFKFYAYAKYRIKFVSKLTIRLYGFVHIIKNILIQNKRTFTFSQYLMKNIGKFLILK